MNLKPIPRPPQPAPIRRPIPPPPKAENSLFLTPEPAQLPKTIVKDTGQLSLLEVPEQWQEEWKGMPEFVSRKNGAFRTIYIHFEKDEEVQRFAQLIAQKVTAETKYLWYPEMTVKRVAHLRYIAEVEQAEQEQEA